MCEVISLDFCWPPTIPKVHFYKSSSFGYDVEVVLIPDFVCFVENLKMLHGYFQLFCEEHFYVVEVITTGSVFEGFFIGKQSYNYEVRCHSLRNDFWNVQNPRLTVGQNREINSFYYCVLKINPGAKISNFTTIFYMFDYKYFYLKSLSENYYVSS